MSRNLLVISSELVLLETLVKPIREKKASLEAAFRAFLLESDEFRLVPIELGTIERAARLRAESGLKAPDAIHAATALEVDCALFLTNDPAFRRVDGLSVAVLGETS
ncbi:MAG: PIN domain-containing protein [Phycisphaerae bacterium]